MKPDELKKFHAWNDEVIRKINSDFRVKLKMGRHPQWRMYGKVFKSMYLEGLSIEQSYNLYMLNYLR